MENKTMLIDFYEFTMGQTYFDKGKVNKKAYLMFSLGKILLKVDIQYQED